MSVRMRFAMCLFFGSACAAWAAGCGSGDSGGADGDADVEEEFAGDELDGRDDGDGGRDDGAEGEAGEAGEDGDDGDAICLCVSDPDCDDGLFCNGEEQCVACLCQPGTGEADGTTCNDGDVCTDGETCSGGVCTGGTPTCTCDVDNDCLPYDDGNRCNGRPLCEGGVCVFDPGTVVRCDPSGDTDCAVNTCAPATGLCTMAPVADGTACDDGNGCTEGEACVEGACAGGTSTCECTIDADCGPYEDGNLCNGTLHCVVNACILDPATIVVCDPSGDTTCRVNLCTPSTGACALAPRADGTTCDDGDACTLADACAAGSCTGAARTCNDGNVCTDDRCDAATGCVFTANSATCDDGSVCTGGDHCSGGSCVGSVMLVCEDGNVCTDDTCNAVTGCVFTANSATCDDGSVCTGGDHCSGGACIGSVMLVCEDDNVCTTDRCDPVLGCVFANNTLPCDDGNSCTTPDACAGGLCVGTPTGLTNCGGECVDLTSDHDHCGNCTTACAFDENCVARVCTVRPWDAVGAAVNPALSALAHALGTNGTDAYVAWVADEAPQDNVYVHRYAAATGWTAVGARLTGGGQVAPVVDIQFNAAVPNVLYLEQAMMVANSVHVKAYDGAAWSEIGAPGYTPPCVMWFSGALTLRGANPQFSSLGAGGCGIGVAYAHWTGTAWWASPSPPSPMVPGLLTMNGGGCTDVVWDSAGTRTLVALIDSGNRYVRFWTPLPAPGAWTNLGGSLNMRPPGPGAMGGDYLWMALDASGNPWVAFSETDGATRGIFVKRYDPLGTGWTLVGATRVSDAVNNADFPSLAFVGGVAYVAYVEQVGGVGLLRVRRWSGTAWERVGTALNVSVLATAAMPYLVAVGSVPYVAFREPATGTQRIYVKRFP